MNAAVVTIFATGSVLEILGLIVGVVGFRKTWREFSTGGRLFARDLERLKRARRVVARVMRRLFRRPHPTRVVNATANISLGAMTGTATGTVQFGALPSPTDDPERFVAELERRFNRVHDGVQSVQTKLVTEAEARKAVAVELERDLRREITRVEGLSRSVAIGGLREQVIGWFCIAVGFSLQTLANFMQAVG